MLKENHFVHTSFNSHSFSQLTSTFVQSAQVSYLALLSLVHSNFCLYASKEVPFSKFLHSNMLEWIYEVE